MSVFEKLINVIKSDIVKHAEAHGNNIVNSNMPHAEYTAAQTRYRTLSEVVGHINTALKFVVDNPDSDVPDSFIPAEVKSDKKESESVTHSVDIDSGSISQGAN